MQIVKSKSLIAKVAATFLCLVLCTEARAGHKHKHKHRHKDNVVEASASPLADPASSNGCDPALWKYVYNPTRLKVLVQCKTVTGVITESNADDDGDQHMLLKLDKGQNGLLTERNIKKKQGCLVIEAVCANKVKLKKVGTTCNGYINRVQIPAVGAHVRVTGSLVDDTHNGWNEIHPITKIEIIK